MRLMLLNCVQEEGYVSNSYLINSWAPLRCGGDFQSTIFEKQLHHEKSTLVQVMAWCHQATSHYLSHC